MSDAGAPRRREVVVLALADLGGARQWVDTEDIAVRANQLAPGAFSWRKYPDQIDLDGVRVALYDAAKPKYGPLVEGSVRSGWSLTPAGIRWVAQHRPVLHERLREGRSPRRRDESRAETRKRALERGRIRKLEAWRLWEAGHPVSRKHAEAVFRIDSETPRSEISIRIQRIVGILANDPAVGAFVRTMAALVSRPDSDHAGAPVLVGDDGR
jgi:hypothetical protein